MNNVLYEPLPQEWNGYQLNTWFQIGVQIYLVSEDEELMDFERADVIVDLLFPGECPPPEEMRECIGWFLNGWYHDKSPKEKKKHRLLDFHKDQWRIYADFRQIYGINLNEADLHWWEFMALLWNMPRQQSSFLQVIELRQKKITSRMGKEEKEAIRRAQYIYGLERGSSRRREYTEEEKQRIDEVDRIRADMKAKKRQREEALAAFRR